MREATAGLGWNLLVTNMPTSQGSTPVHMNLSLGPILILQSLSVNWDMVCTNDYFNLCDYKFKIEALRILISENTFAGHWETLVDCMETIEKHQ